jgi:hypothetical protein
MQALIEAVKLAVINHSPLRVTDIENNESVGCCTPWGAAKVAKDWILERETDWEELQGEFRVTLFGFQIATFTSTAAVPA